MDNIPVCDVKGGAVNDNLTELLPDSADPCKGL